MTSYLATVAYTSLQCDLVNLPPQITTLLANSNTDLVIELSWKAPRESNLKRAFVGWTGMASTGRDRDLTQMTSFTPPKEILMVEIDPTVALSLKLPADTNLTLTLHFNVPAAHTVHLEPRSASDWEIVELNAAVLESRMINQVRAISLLHPITVFASTTTAAELIVLSFEPTSNLPFARIAPDCEVIVAPKTRANISTKTSESLLPQLSSNTNTLSFFSVVRRAACLPNKAFFGDLNAHTGVMEYIVYVDDQDPNFHIDQEQYVAVSVIVPPNLITLQNRTNITAPANLNSTNTNMNTTNSTTNTTLVNQISATEGIPTTKVIAKLVGYSSCPEGHVAISFALADALGIQTCVGSSLLIESAPPRGSESMASSVTIQPFTTDSSPSKEFKFKPESEKSIKTTKGTLVQYLTQSQFFQQPLTHLMRLPIIDKLLPAGGVLKLKVPKSEPWGWTITIPGQVPSVEIGTKILREKSSISESSFTSAHSSAASPPRSLRPIVGIDNMLTTVNATIREGHVGVLIYGASGSGKTALLQQVSRSLSPDLIHSVKINCGPMAEDHLSSIREAIQGAFAEAIWYAPSVVILDDLDRLIPAEVEHADSSRSRQLAEVIQQSAYSALTSRQVSLIATAQSRESIHMHLIISHLFEEMVHVKSPDKQLRKTVVECAINTAGLKAELGLDGLEIASLTEGYQPGDLWTLVERAQHEGLMRSKMTERLNSDLLSVPSTTLIMDDFTRALADFVPAGLRGVKLQKSGAKWNTIGGLKETKAVLLETLEWPTRYAPIFASCPLRLRSGLLLYGYPGCGKTLLASAVAQECGLNFISIKGPEILNKYIGASEQSVRDLFDRAAAAKPCILFFDEFDSIAPKRGHDSTGVTDRVVNQMLTQMDGAEGLDGVYVLAATSRPDLIDSALLRPGRLDKSLICDLPHFEDRLDILKAVQGDIKLAPEVELTQIAESTDGYSGADLQAVLYNAYLEAIHDVIDIPQEDDFDNRGQSNKPIHSDRIDFMELSLNSTKHVEDTNGESPVYRRTLAMNQVMISSKLDALFLNDGVAPRNSTLVNEQEQNIANQILVRTHHIKSSLETTKPSISAKERLKLQAIYESFVSGRSGDMPNGTASMDIGGRTTLM
ncbi:AAA-domain-containing protein [Nadsonia fulvescens var. elongata DSM 6958]|uniref:Peroxisomal ATPase PEX1 n=1 Tax=Nadsonia fulvescens var. elongata DSM 6958 TaxID=857566 RepID=A0A1E3PF53_9ASCO|nr:AAA-domain-containing protein [Nadsonia fulvescens var. elongata DSM 6958]